MQLSRSGKPSGGIRTTMEIAGPNVEAWTWVMFAVVHVDGGPRQAIVVEHVPTGKQLEGVPRSTADTRRPHRRATSPTKGHRVVRAGLMRRPASDDTLPLRKDTTK